MTSRSARGSPSGVPLIRLMIVGLGALIVSVLALTQGLATVVMRTDPELALRIAPNSGRAYNRLAELRTASLPPERYREIAPLAREALRREPLAVGSATLLSVDAMLAGDRSRADRLLDYASRLSRRNLSTQLLLIERAVSRNDAAGALRQFDITLRTSQTSFPTLFPVLANAIADPYFLEPMKRIAREDPSWFPFFVGEAVTVDGALPNLARIMAAAPDTATGRNEELRQNLLDRMVATGRVGEARRYYQAIHPDVRGLVLDQRFSRPDLQPPFGWRLASEPDLLAEYARGEGLHYIASADRGGVLASQTVMLRAGRYRLDMPVQPAAGSLGWSLRCEGTAADIPSERSVSSGRLTTRFAVPEGCQTQMLSLEIAPSSDPAGQEGTVSGMTITAERP